MNPGRRLFARVIEILPCRAFELAVDRPGSDQLIRLRGPRTRTLYPDTLRRIAYVDPETGS